MSKSKKPDIAFSVKKVPGGWSLVEYHIADGKVVKEKRSEPDYRDIALEAFIKQTSIFWLSDD